jgi:hypothetical protein
VTKANYLLAESNILWKKGKFQGIMIWKIYRSEWARGVGF